MFSSFIDDDDIIPTFTGVSGEEYEVIPVLKPGSLYDEDNAGFCRFGRDLSQSYKDFDFEKEGEQIRRELGGKQFLTDFPRDEEIENLRRNRVDSIEESIFFFVKWKPESQRKCEYVVDLKPLFSQKIRGQTILSKIFSYCDMLQVISSFLQVNRVFYDSSIELLKRMELGQKECKILFGWKSCISEALFLKLMHSLEGRVKTIHFTKIAPGRDFYGEVLTFCLFHKFRKAAIQFLSSNTVTLKREDVAYAVHDRDDELLLLMLKKGIEVGSRLNYDARNYNRLFIFNRNIEGLKLYNDEYYRDIWGNEVDIIDITRDKHFLHQLILDKKHAKKNAEILKLLVQIRHFALDKFQITFFSCLPLLPFEIVKFFLTTSPTNMRYFLIPVEANYVINGIEVNEVMSKREKKELVDFVFYYNNKKPRIQRAKEEEEGEEEEEEDASDIDQGEKDEKKKEELHFKPESSLGGYQFVYFYGRGGYREEFEQALDLVSGEQVYTTREFDRSGFSPEFLELAVASGKVVTIRPKELHDSIVKAYEEEKKGSKYLTKEEYEKEMLGVGFEKIFSDFHYLKGGMDDDLDEVVRLAIKLANNTLFKRLMQIPQYHPGREPFVTSMENKNSKDVVKYLGRAYVEGGTDENRSTRVDQLVRILNERGMVGQFKDLLGEILSMKNFTAGPQFIVSLEDLPNSKELLNTFWRNFNPPNLRDLMELFHFAVRNKRKDTLQKLMKSTRVWKESYLLMLRFDPRPDNLRLFGNMFPILKRRVSVGCFHCGKVLKVLDHKLQLNVHFSLCQTCSVDKNTLLDRKLPVETRDLEKFYCTNCTRVRNNRRLCTFCVDNVDNV